MSIIDHPHWTAALEICQKLTQAGFRALLAGGCVRDHILGRIANDIDLVTNATPEDIEQLFERVVPVGKQFGVMRVVIDSVSLEVASFRSDGAYIDGRRPVNVQLSTPEADAHRRDFTVNAMFMDPKSLEILDFVGGQADLQQHLLKAVGEPEVRFQEDHLRVLRAVRFVAQLGFKLDAATGAAVVASAPLTASVSGERLQEELNKLYLNTF
jgi:tRNA nucleotidyltransferase/poly(A) polymerase